MSFTNPSKNFAAAFAFARELSEVKPKIGNMDDLFAFNGAQPELAMGAVVDGSAPIIVRNEDVIQLAGVHPAALWHGQRSSPQGCRNHFRLVGYWAALLKQGIRIGSVKDGKVLQFIPLTDSAIGSAEELAADDQGNVFAGFTAKGKMAVRKFVKN